MALQIIESNGVLGVHGKLNTETVHTLKRHISLLINANQPLTINLNYLKGIDTSATNELHKLYIKAMRSNSILSIIGRENKHIFSKFKHTKTSHILRKDRA